MASVSQLATKIEKLKTRISTRQSELATLKAQQKDLKDKLAVAKKSGKNSKGSKK